MNEWYWLDYNIFENKEYDEKDHDLIVRDLNDYIKRCKYLETNYGALIRITKDMKVGMQVHGPCIINPDGTFDYFYNIRGGYYEAKPNK